MQRNFGWRDCHFNNTARANVRGPTRVGRKESLRGHAVFKAPVKRTGRRSFCGMSCWHIAGRSTLIAGKSGRRHFRGFTRSVSHDSVWCISCTTGSGTCLQINLPPAPSGRPRYLQLLPSVATLQRSPPLHRQPTPRNSHERQLLSPASKSALLPPLLESA